MKILGAGMSGCLAGLVFPNAEILEAQNEPPINHGAVLRFRDDSVSKITGIPFKKVTVRKAIVYNGKFIQPNIQICNEYSLKVTGKVQDRSIWNLETVQRYIAPHDFQQQLFDLVANRVNLGIAATSDMLKCETTLSTIPMPTMCRILSMAEPAELKHKKITVVIANIHNCDVYQTIYFPEFTDQLYRATITGNKLIMEFIGEIPENLIGNYMDLITAQMSINYPMDSIEQKSQKYGKIDPIDDSARRQFLYMLTCNHNIYSAGRFAIWKNILMDDVLHDLFVIREMMAKDSYEHNKRK
jgi:hypothetical protein